MSNLVLEAMRNGGLYNPIRSAVDSALGTFQIPSVAELQVLATGQSIITGLPVPPAQEIQAAQAAIVNAYNKIGDLLGHTDRISGVDLTGNTTLATIAKTMGSARNATGELSCNSVLAAFGAISKAGEFIKKIEEYIQLVEDFKQNVAAKIVETVIGVTALAAKITEQIANDVGAYAAAQLRLAEEFVANSISSLVQDECMSAILSNVMTQEMKNVVNTQIDKTATELRKARYGY
jgi:hypothetical protein